MTSLGGIHRQPPRLPTTAARAPPKPAPAPAPKTLQKASTRTERVAEARAHCRLNAFSCCSLFGCASICSFVSGLSILSAGSVLSVLSVGSTLSVLSAGSVNSFLSIGSNGCSMRFFADCRAAYPDAEVAFEVSLSDEVWHNMSECTFDEYQRFKKYEDPDLQHCDYHPANCSYVNLATGTNVSGVACEVRRKGFTTWEALGERPSLKVKFDDDVDLGTIDGVELVVDELTLNNQKFSDSWSGHREVEAYDLFREIGFANTPVSAHAEVTLIKGGSRRATQRYALVQNVNDGGFLKQHWKDSHPGREYDEGGYMLFEVDNRGLEFKKGKKKFKTDNDVSIALMESLINREGDLLSLMDPEDLSRFYAAEVLTGNWDGACLRYIPNNHYVSVTQSDDDAPVVRFLPKGMDRVFQGCAFDMGQSYFSGGMHPPYCGPMQRLLDNSTLASRYAHILDNATRTASVSKRTCGEDTQTLSYIIIANVCGAVFLYAIGVSCAIALTRWLIEHRRATVTELSV